MVEQKQNRIWIELERPESDEQGHERAQLANNMLERLGFTMGNKFWWWPEKKTYCYTHDRSGVYNECGNNGEWLNLDFVGRKKEE